MYLIWIFSFSYFFTYRKMQRTSRLFKPKSLYKTVSIIAKLQTLTSGRLTKVAYLLTINILYFICTIGPMFWAVKKEVRRKRKYSNSKVTEENITVVYYSAMIAATRKVHFSCVLLLPSSWWWRGVGESWLLDTRLTDRS